ncbi:ricin-type beta-trefoil lectin domain protein [Kitasatospora sp. McL0602]|uniref:ricin-type beta-trefoil lectin domain protein n=1 Tax=Kitasatospora sp. McL0602 TaxID=3439530 RepID=UPI003F89EA25
MYLSRLRRARHGLRTAMVTAAFCLVVPALAGTVAAPAALAAAPVGPVTGLAGKCVDVSGAGTADGTPVILYHCNGAQNQAWTVPGDGTLRALGKCLAVVGGSTANGALAELRSCDTTGAQQWTPTGGELVNPQSGKCLDVPGSNTADSTRLEIWSCGAAQPNQTWTLPTATGGSGGGSGSGNLIVDPGGEAASCTMNGADGMTVPGWTIAKGEPNVICYANTTGYPTTSTPGSPTRAGAFFSGGGTGDSRLTQTADVSSAATAVDAGGVSYNLGGWLGGYSSQNDRVALTATFLGATGSTLGSSQIGPVSNTDRGNTTEFLQRAATGTLPAGTRSIRVDLTFIWSSGVLDGYADDLSLTLSTPVPTAQLTVPASSVPGYDHVFVVYMENENYSDIIGSSSAPYINSLARANTSLTQSYATTHPSDPNYVALAAGSLYGLTDNSILTTSIDAPHLGNSVEAAGKTWKAYVENQNGNCDTAGHGHYYPDDVPFYYFKQLKTDAAYCQAHWQPLTSMFDDLKSTATTPNFTWFAADGCDDMEDCGIAAGDTWLKNTLPALFSSPAWTTQRSLLILTWDEGAVKAFGNGYPNQVPTILIGSQNSTKAGYQSAQRTDQYGLLRTIDQALGLNPLTNNDKYAATVNDAWQ